jgi:hypothetical protein
MSMCLVIRAVEKVVVDCSVEWQAVVCRIAQSELEPLVFGNIHLTSRNFTTLIAYLQQRKVKTN